MRFSHKIFISFFLTTLLLGSGLIWIGYTHVRDQTKEEFISRYQVFSKVMGDTLTRLDKNTELLMLNAVKVLAASDLAEGLLPTERLKEMSNELSMTHMFVVDKNGKFIRSTNEDPRLIPNAFSFCSKYKNMVMGKSNIEATPIIHPNPEPKPYKFLFIPNHNRERLLEVGVRVDFVAKTLTEALGSDSNILSMSLYAPNGQSFGRFNSKDVDFKGNKVDLPNQFPAMRESGESLRFFTKVESSHPSCCQCDVSGTSKNGEYYYVLESEVSKSELAALQATTRNIFIGLAIGNLILAFLLSRLISRRLVRNIEVAVEKVRQLKSDGGLKSRLNLGGKDEVAFLTKEFDRLLDKIEDSQQKIIENKKIEVKVQMAKEIAHNIKSPITAIEMMLPMVVKMPDQIKNVLNNSVKEIKALSQKLKIQADAMSFESTEPETMFLPIILKELVAQKQLEYSSRSEIQIELIDDSSNVDAFVKGVSLELKSIISNLINNAVESYMHGGIVSLRLQSDIEKCIITVTDTGVGIPSEHLQGIGSKPISFKGNKCRGLGLTHAYKIIQSWGGNISIDSKVGSGTSVSILLPKNGLFKIQDIKPLEDRSMQC